MSATEQNVEKPEPGQDVNVSLIAVAGIFLAVALFVLIIGLQAWFYTFSAEEKAAKTVPDNTFESMKSLQEQQITAQGEWQGKVLPIEQAMDRVQQQYAVNKVK